jgi:peptidoglycan hydrolase-like protein with peptidoglycan-binding domain
MIGLSWWDWQETAKPGWRAIGARDLNSVGPVDRSGLYPTIGHRATGDAVVWAQEHLNGAGLKVRVTGKLNKETSQALSSYQKRIGIKRTGILDAATWKRLMKARPQMVNWARRHDKTGTAGPASAQTPPIHDEIQGNLGAARR